MKIAAVLGSPRSQGNSSTLAHKFLETARELGAEVRVYPLNLMNFQGCQGCGACKANIETCIQEDDLAPVLEAVKAADVLVMASPVYFGDLSGQLKCFFDRTYSYFNPDFSSRLPGGKKAVIVLVQANPDEGQFNDIFPRYQRWLTWFGYTPVYLLRAVGVKDPGDIRQQAALLDQAASLAQEIMK
ncbi:MAG: flavodoxin family protein [Deltaproteobacteria bacterium]|nr:flavodoxin family protein [Deltaproteobacteria bacterium]MBI4795225.1 flavodoxin family protein [Deltaproteobacteria bacterium]